MKKSIVLTCVSIAALNALVACGPKSETPKIAGNDTVEVSASDISPLAEKFPVETFKLENGLTILVSEDTQATAVNVVVYSHVGSKDEPRGKSGFAHLFEHLLFNGTQKNPGEFFDYIDEIGGTNANAFTGWDQTVYFETVPKGALERMLWLESDRMENTAEAVSQKSLSTQIDVVKNEKSQTDNEPFGKAVYTAVETMYPEEHPYGHTIIGSVADLEAASLEDVKQWYKDYYGAANTYLALSGNITVEEAKALSKKYFAHLPPGPPLTKLKAQPVKLLSNSLQVNYDVAPQNGFSRSYILPPIKDPKSAVMAVGMELFASGENSPLYKALVEDQEIADAVDVYLERRELSAQLDIIVEPASGVKLEDVSKAVDVALQKYLKAGPSKDDVERYYGRNKAQLIEDAADSLYRVLGLVESLATYGDPLYPLKELEWINTASPTHIREAAQKGYGQNYHEQHNIAVEERRALRPNIDLSIAPPVKAPAKVTLPLSETFTLPNGLKVVHVNRPDTAFLEMSYVTPRGVAHFTPKQSYIADALTGFILDYGVPGLSKAELAKQMEASGVKIEAFSDETNTQLNLTTTPENFEQGFNWWTSLLTEAEFNQADMDDYIEGQIEDLEISQNDISAVFESDIYSTVAYGAKNTLTMKEMAVAIEQLTAESLKTYYQKWIRPEGAILYVVGDITRQELEEKLLQNLSRWIGRVEDSKLVKRNYPASHTGHKFILVDEPDVNQTEIVMYKRVAPSAEKDPYIRELANDAIAGAFTSRMSLNLREDKGWTYGVRALYSQNILDTNLSLASSVSGEYTLDAVKEIIAEFKQAVSSKPISEDELSTYSDFQIRSFGSGLSSNAEVLALFKRSDELEKPYSYFNTIASRYDSVTLPDINDAAQDLFDSNGTIWMLLGDLSTFEDKIRSSGLGPVEVYDKTGKRVR